ncbi:hypothetical protein JGU71_09200 [Antrihabitans sp. YC3-6]|uniref:Uncharacterized protein n=1 Tax=Antrihabitans stalagmiti TaxID=2799499 RepID=A0A934U2J8_9NOCA|nr:hypothetical protein [Antrihabitans stalagmiti]MBJ8339060.1 hypothetical protein [Antrihabitans stalagmiti]
MFDPKQSTTSDLGDVLGHDLPVLAQLTSEQSADLVALIRQTRTSQQNALDMAITEALGHFPWAVRGAARKILFG